MRFSLALLALALAACTQTPKRGGFQLPNTGGSLAVKLETPATTYLESFMKGSGAYAPVAVRTADARIEEKYGAFKFTDGPGAWTEARRFTWDDVTADHARGSWRDAKDKPVVKVEVLSQLDGEVGLQLTAVDPNVNRLSLAFGCADSDHFIGFGAQADALDHKGHTVPIWTSEPGIGKQMENDDYPDLWFLVGTRHASSYGLPTWHSNRGYIGAVETDRRSVFELCSARSDAWRVEVWDNHATLWVFRSTVDNRAIGLAANRVLGFPVQPPDMTWAPWNDAIFGSAEVRRVAKELRDNDIPSSLIWTEDFRGGRDDGDAYRLIEDWDLDRTLYPDAEQVASELRAQGFGWLAYFNPFIVKGSKVWDEAQAGGHFVQDATGAPYLFTGPTFTDTGLADLTRPETRDWFKLHLGRALDVGFAGWMADFGEWLPHDAVLAGGVSPLDAHNLYPRYWAQLNEELLASRQADAVARLFFMRSGWFQSNEHVPVVWLGDQRTSFQPDDGLPTVVPLELGLGLAAVSTVGSDIGGYQSATNPPATKELFFRWTTLGALSPVMRTHHGTNPRQQWRFDSDAETLAHYKRWARFHMQLYPYLQASAAEAEATGMPIVRALPLHFPREDRSWTIADEYLLGGALLVAPVMTEGATSRSVYLPKADWVGLGPTGNDVLYPGGDYDVSVNAPVGEIPLFVRAGAVIPRLPASVMTVLDAGDADLKHHKDERSLLLVTGGSGGFMERDGTTYGVVTLPGVSSDIQEDGVTLPDCASATARGCVDRAGPRVVVRMKGTTSLSVAGTDLSIDSPTAKTIDVEVVAPTVTFSP